MSRAWNGARHPQLRTREAPPPMTPATERLGKAIKARREALGMTQAEAAARARMSMNNLSRIERGNPARGVTYFAIEGALRWAPGTCRDVLSGGDPTAHTGTEDGYDTVYLPLLLPRSLPEGARVDVAAFATQVASRAGRVINDAIARAEAGR